MAKRVNEIDRIRTFFKVTSPDRVMLLKILCADAGITISEPRAKKAAAKGKKKPAEFGHVDGVDAQPR